MQNPFEGAAQGWIYGIWSPQNPKAPNTEWAYWTHGTLDGTQQDVQQIIRNLSKTASLWKTHKL